MSWSHLKGMKLTIVGLKPNTVLWGLTNMYEIIIVYVDNYYIWYVYVIKLGN